MTVSPDEKEQWRALVDATTLAMLPKEALVASIKNLAARLLEISAEAGE